MTRQTGLIILAVVLFAVALILHVFVDPTPSFDTGRWVQGLLLGGLTSFAAGHLP